MSRRLMIGVVLLRLYASIVTGSWSEKGDFGPAVANLPVEIPSSHPAGLHPDARAVFAAHGRPPVRPVGGIYLRRADPAAAHPQRAVAVRPSRAPPRLPGRPGLARRNALARRSARRRAREPAPDADRSAPRAGGGRQPAAFTLAPL